MGDKAWELPPDFEFESQGRGREGLGLTFSVPHHSASPGRGKQAADPHEESASGGAASSAPVGALQRSPLAEDILSGRRP